MLFFSMMVIWVFSVVVMGVVFQLIRVGLVSEVVLVGIRFSWCVILVQVLVRLFRLWWNMFLFSFWLVFIFYRWYEFGLILLVMIRCMKLLFQMWLILILKLISLMFVLKNMFDRKLFICSVREMMLFRFCWLVQLKVMMYFLDMKGLFSLLFLKLYLMIGCGRVVFFFMFRCLVMDFVVKFCMIIFSGMILI